MGATTGRAAIGARLGVVAVVVLAIGVLLLPDPAPAADFLVSTTVGIAMSVVVAGCAWWRAVAAGGRRRYGWAVLGAASACTAVGGALRIWQEATGNSSFPSPADAAALAFGPLACAGLCLLPVHANRERRLQAVLDAMATSWALALVSWQTALGAVVRATTGQDQLAAAVVVTYPAMDVVLLVFTALTLARAAPGTPRRPLAVLAAGLVALCVSDSAFFFLAASGSYPVDVLVEIGWVLGAGCLAMAPLLDDRDTAPPPAPEAAPSTGGLLPYVPMAGVLAVWIATQFNGRASTLSEELAEHGLVVLLILRQYLTLRQNHELARRLAAREQELHHLAFHDPLTGLANWALFRERLERALDAARARAPPARAAVPRPGRLQAGQRHPRARRRRRAAGRGRAAGARRGPRAATPWPGWAATSSRCCWRPGTTRTASPRGSPRRCARRSRSCDGDVRARASVGVVELAGADPTPSADEILARADLAMYASKRLAKRAGTPR